mgnify:CR=1 FL=1
MKKTLDIKKLILLNMPYILLGLFATNFGEAWRMAQGADASEKFLSLVAVLPGALQSFWPSLHPLDLLVGLCCGVGLRLAVYLKSKNAKKYRHGLEYGSARWGTREDIAPYVDPVFQNNVILTKTESLTMNSRPKDPKTARNKNVLVIGGGDTGNDCQGTALRQGCTDLVALEMMPQPPKERAASNPWPEWPRVLKVDYGQTECLAKFNKDPRIYQTTVKEFLKDDAGNLTGAVISYLKPERDPETGRTRMVPTGEEFAIECDLVLIAAGFTGCQPYVAEAFGVDLTKRGTVADTKYATNVPHVFTCGDMRRGQSLVVWALREGRDAAAEVDKSLMGYTNL